MKKFKIQICLLGYQRYLDKIEKLQNYSSKLFEVTNCIVIKQLPPPATLNGVILIIA